VGFALLLRFYTEQGRFPRGRSEIPDSAVEYVSRQVDVAASEVAFYDWSGRTIKAHRVQIRRALEYRECGVADAEKLTEWLVANGAGQRQPEHDVDRDRQARGRPCGRPARQRVRRYRAEGGRGLAGTRGGGSIEPPA
jgi:hypothetical protein